MLLEATPVEAILALQKTAGNQAVVTFLGRAETAEKSKKIEELDEELDSFDVDEEKVITLLNGLTDTEVQEVLSGGQRAKVADALDVEEMIRAVKKLPTLVTKLEWIKAAGTPDYDQIRPMIIDPKVPQTERDALSGWREWFVDVCDNTSIKQVVKDLKLALPAQLLFLGKEMCADYSDLKALITAPTVTDDDRTAFNAPSWRTWFVDVCNNETIVEAVKDLKLSLKKKLDWMAEEGTSEEAIGEVTRMSSQAELDEVQLEPGLMTSLQERLSGAEYALVERMVKQGQLGQQDITNTADIGAEFKAVLTMWRTGVVLSKEIKFIEEGTWTPAALEAMIQRCVASVDTWLSRKYKLKIASPSGPRGGRRRVPDHREDHAGRQRAARGHAAFGDRPLEHARRRRATLVRRPAERPHRDHGRDACARVRAHGPRPVRRVRGRGRPRARPEQRQQPDGPLSQ